jgi:AbiV family abortive infection protein
MSKFVGSDHLLEGAVYALEQCGLLLRDANTLYRAKAYASAVVLAAFAREELGRWRMLVGLWREVRKGKEVTVADVEKHCWGHVEKQTAGMVSVAIRGHEEGGELIRALASAVPGTEEWKAIQDKIDDIVVGIRNHIPDERHETRQSALFVDPISANEWSRPVEKITRDVACHFLMDAANDYSIQSSQGYTELEIVKVRELERYEALAKWDDRPNMPAAEWPDPLG